MKNKILILLIITANYTNLCCSRADLLRGYVHNQIHESSIPEYKEFNEKIKKLFQIQNHSSVQQKEAMIKDIRNFGNNLIEKLNLQLNDSKLDLTKSERKTIAEVIEKIKEKLKKLVKKII